MQGAREPLIVDVVDDKIMICDEGKPLEEVFYWEKPDFYNKTTSSGKPMWHIAWARPQRIDINPNQFCQFWQTPGHGCKYCAIAATYRKNDKPQFVNLDDIEETVQEALKQPGRYTSIFLTGGTILDGKELLDDEVNLYIDILKRIGKNFGGKRFPSQLISTAFNKNQLQRLHDETGLIAGVELAKPNGFASEEEALERVLEEAEDFAKNGVSPVG